MDIKLIRVFQQQVLFQCECVLSAAQQADAHLRARHLIAVFAALQNLLTAAANASRALWGQTNRAEVAAARAPLRASIGIADDSPLRSVRMRNKFEHIDEYLDEWWSNSPGHNYCDMNIGPVHTSGGLELNETFRSFDPSTGHVWFWGQSFDLRALLKEVERVLPKLREEAEKPSWET
jgi:hypothetical protein